MPGRCSVVPCNILKEKHVKLFKVPAVDFHSWNEIIAKINGSYNKHKVS